MIARYISLTWTGGMFVVVYSHTITPTGSQLRAQLLDGSGAKVGGAVGLPGCANRPSSIVNLAAAWGGDTLAVASSGYSSAFRKSDAVGRLIGQVDE